jgi:hypothetical protein
MMSSGANYYYLIGSQLGPVYSLQIEFYGSKANYNFENADPTPVRTGLMIKPSLTFGSCCSVTTNYLGRALIIA